jgi:uncharacterized membrane protein
MPEKQLSIESPNDPFLRTVVIISLCFGIFFRFYNLDKKMFWFDETQSANHIAGSSYEWYALLKSGKPIAAKELLDYQVPSKGHGLKEAIKSLIALEPSHAPRFICLLYPWARFVGHTTLHLRFLPALISLLQIPAIYWLCLELSGGEILAVLAVAFTALSPVLVLYAQEARGYSLFVVATLVLSACFLRALRKRSAESWIAYTLAVIFSLYSSLLAILIVSGQLIYLLLQTGPNKRNDLWCFLGGQLAAVIAYSPWILVVWENFDQASAGLIWAAVKTLPTLILVKLWCQNFASCFFDPGSYYLVPVQMVVLTVLLLELYALIEISRTSSQTAKFVLILIGVNSLPFMICDIIFGGIRSTPVRYQLAASLGNIIAVAYLFYLKLTTKKNAEQLAWRLALCALLLGALVSIAISSQASTWKGKSLGSACIDVAKILNQESAAPLLVTDDSDPRNFRQMLVISRMLNPSTKVLLLNKPTLPPLDSGMTHFYVYNVSPTLTHYMAETGKFRLSPFKDIADFARVDCQQVAY